MANKAVCKRCKWRFQWVDKKGVCISCRIDEADVLAIKAKCYDWTYKKKICLICEKPLTYIPVGQRWKVGNIEPVFYHERCAG